MPKKTMTSKDGFFDATLEEDRMELMQVMHESTGIPCKELDSIIEAMLSGDEHNSVLVVASSGAVHTVDHLELGQPQLSGSSRKPRLN